MLEILNEKCVCERCGSEMHPVRIIGWSEEVCEILNIEHSEEILEWGCANSECVNSIHYRSKFKKNNDKSFDFERYKNFRKTLKKRSA